MLQYLNTIPLFQVPNYPAKWHQTATEFEENWNFSNCIRATDGKHTMTEVPEKASTHFIFNYKGFRSIILLAPVDVKYNLWTVS